MTPSKSNKAGILKQANENKRPKSSYQSKSSIGQRSRASDNMSAMPGPSGGLSYAPYSVPNVGRLDK